MNRTFYVVVLVAFTTATALSACTKNGTETAADLLERRAPRLIAAAVPPDVAEPAGYRIAFDRYSPPPAAKTPEHLERVVTRPFSETVGGATRTLGFAADSPNADSRVVLLRPLADDPRPRVYAARALRSQRRVAGRVCRDYRPAPGTDYCVDSAGLVLASSDGTRVEIATKVTAIDTPESPALLTTQLAAGFNNVDRGSVRPIDPSSSAPGAVDWSLPSTPAGFTFVGRYAVVALSDALLSRNSRKVAAGVVDVYVRGIDTVIVDRGGRLDTSDVTDDDLGRLTNASTVDLGQLGTGRVGTGGIGPFGYREVRAAPAQGRYVVVAGTLPAADLVTLARLLQPTPGTPLHYLDNN